MPLAGNIYPSLGFSKQPSAGGLPVIVPRFLRSLLADYLGEDQMMAIVFQSSAAVTPPEEYEHELSSVAAELGKCITDSPLLIYLEDIRQVFMF